MPTCRYCGGTFETAELIRHEYEGRLLVVHCPSCRAAMGSYRVQSPATDTHRPDRTQTAATAVY